MIEWGDGLYGGEAAARRYFGKPASDLTLEEAAMLAAAIPSPRRLNPLVDPVRNARAARRVLWLMAQAGYIRREVAGLGSEPPPVVVPEEEGEPPRAGSPPTDPQAHPGESPSPSIEPVTRDTGPPGPGA